MSEEKNSHYSVHESVVISIVRKAIRNIPGLVRLAGSSFVSDLVELVGGSAKKLDRSIIVNSEENGSVSIEIRIVCEYGTYFVATASAVQKAVYEQVTDYTGMHINEIKVLITDVEEAQKDDDDSDDIVDGEVIDAEQEEDPADATI